MLVGFAKGRSTAQRARYRCLRHPRPTQGAGAKYCPDTAKLVKFGMEIVEDDVVLFEGYASPGYGLPSEATKQAIRLSARLEGIITDPVYEGKSMQAMIDLVQKGFFPEGSRVHLGGGPAINGYSYTFRNG
ncbi:hypothetical protein NKJ87_19195 [Mesorhizobium sp. M0027]|uniref:hypothetical protein n=1 Tax=Mesorhizobium sp. M0027 TaxID=2956848 RepID=UPI003335D55D